MEQENNELLNMSDWLIQLRRDFHRHPELSGMEERTTKKIIQVLTDLDVQVQAFENMTGVVGLIKGSKTNEPYQGTIALRADIDALPLDEATDLSYSSVNSGIMHACGHDAHTAICLGVAKMIKDSNIMEQINGNVKFIFQPAEEQLGGALAMIKKGALENPKVDRIIAGHMDPNIAVGKAGVFKRIGHAASDPFELIINGKGSHGARPHMGRSPIIAGALFVAQVDSIIPRLVPPVHSAVISVGCFNAGKAGNVIPEQTTIKGSVRTHDPEIREMILKEMHALAKGIGIQCGVHCELTIRPGAPMGLNDESASKSFYTASSFVLGEKNVEVLPFIMGSDDFYFFTQQCPGAMMRLGCNDPNSTITYPLHSPMFDIHEDVLEIGAKILFKAVETFFNEKKAIKKT
jgi:amidohydrolase